MTKLVHDAVVCAGCTCLCDDIRISIKNDQVVETTNACQLGKEWFCRESVTPRFAVNGKPVEFEAAVAETVKLLHQSKSPLIGGLDGLSTQAQITAVEIAKRVRATIDTTFTNHQRGGTLTMQSVGKVTATLGELASRADVVLFWCCDPATTHPRFFERFCKNAGQTVLIDHSRTATAEFVSQFIQIDRTAVYGLLSELRLASNNSNRNNISEHGRVILDVLQNAEYVASVYGGLNDDPKQTSNLQALYQLTRQLNQQIRAVVIGLRNDANAQSAENVLAWNSGYPFGVNFGRGVAEYNGLEFSAQSVLERGECDAALICSTISLGELSDAALANLKRIPTVVIEDSVADLGFTPTIRFEVGFNRGDWCRMDDIALPVLAPPFGGDEAMVAGNVLRSVLAGLS